MHAHTHTADSVDQISIGANCAEKPNARTLGPFIIVRPQNVRHHLRLRQLFNTRPPRLFAAHLLTMCAPPRQTTHPPLLRVSASKLKHLGYGREKRRRERKRAIVGLTPRGFARPQEVLSEPPLGLAGRILRFEEPADSKVTDKPVDEVLAVSAPRTATPLQT